MIKLNSYYGSLHLEKWQGVTSFRATEEIMEVLLKVKAEYDAFGEAGVKMSVAIDDAIDFANLHHTAIAAAMVPATYSSVEKYLELLTQCYGLPDRPTGSLHPRDFARLVSDDVQAMKPSVAALETACRRWRVSKPALPSSISEFLKAVRIVKNEFESAAAFVDLLPVLKGSMAR